MGHSVGILFAELQPNAAFQVTLAQHERLELFFGDAVDNRMELRNSHRDRLHINLSPWDLAM